MPLLPWKSTRSSRISQIVADLQSPKRGGSLVVETGFPTSLVDLFVKHRDRLRKPSARRKSKDKRSKNEFSDSIVQPSSQSHPPEIDCSDAGGGCVQRENLEMEDLKVLDEPRECRDRGCELLRNRTETCVVGGDAAGRNGVVLFVLKMFVVAVVVLALSAKKLVVGTTLSAFLLLLLEFVGKRSVRFLKPCTHGETALRSLIRKVLKHLWIGKDDLVIQESRNYGGDPVPKVSLDAFPNESIDSPEFSSSIEEIRLVEPEVDACETPKGIEDEKSRLGFLGDEKENKDRLEVQVCENERGTRGKRNRSMFRKLVRKKSGRQAIEKKNNTEEKEFRNDRLDKASIEEQVNKEDDENLEEEQHEQEQERDLEIRTIFCEEDQDSRKPPDFDEQWQAMEVRESCEIQGIKKKGRLSYLILVLVVLAGLFGGRFLAVVLTTACCFMIKLKEFIWRRSMNPPLKTNC